MKKLGEIFDFISLNLGVLKTEESIPPKEKVPCNLPNSLFNRALGNNAWCLGLSLHGQFWLVLFKVFIYSICKPITS
jgi:hypothetical protein